MDFELKKDKKGNDHIVPKSNTLTYKVQRAYFQLENLFGNKQLCKYNTFKTTSKSTFTKSVRF